MLLRSVYRAVCPVASSLRFSSTQAIQGDSHAFILRDGALFGWGKNDIGQLGRKNSKEVTETPKAPISSTCLPHITSVSAGVIHSTAIDENGLIWSWGANNFGQLGIGKVNSSNYLPECLYNLSPMKMISSVGMSNISLDKEGFVWAWGWNNAGKLGFPHEKEILLPTKHENVSNITHISSGIAHSILIDDQGEVWVFGDNKYNQLGVNSKRRTLPLQKHPDMSGMVSSACGMGKSLLLDKNGVVYESGSTKQELFNRNLEITHQPFAPIEELPTIKEIGCGSFHHVARDYEDNVWVWGAGDRGQLGLGDRNDFTIPQKLPFNGTIQQFSCGGDTTLFVDQEDKVWKSGKKFFNSSPNDDVLAPQLVEQ